MKTKTSKRMKEKWERNETNAWPICDASNETKICNRFMSIQTARHAFDLFLAYEATRHNQRGRARERWGEKWHTRHGANSAACKSVESDEMLLWIYHFFSSPDTLQSGFFLLTSLAFNSAIKLVRCDAKSLVCNVTRRDHQSTIFHSLIVVKDNLTTH